VTLQLTNTLSRRREPFVPLVPGQVSLYCCGVTVYDLCHLGHARSYINWDVLRRYLIWSGYAVTFVQNYTDIDDKILKRAAEEGSSMQAVSERNIEAFAADMARLNILPADRMPRATLSLGAIRALIEELEAKGAAYSADGDVYFAVMKHAGYGKLSGRDLAEQQDNAGGRVATTEEARKQHPFDFALWKGPSRGSPAGNPPGARAGRAGTSSARRWCARSWATRSTSTSAVPTWCSPPRERDRPVGGGHGPGAGPLLAAQRHGECGRRKDGQVARQLHHHPGPAGFGRQPDDPAAVHPAGPLPQAARLHRRGPGGRRHRLEGAQCSAGAGRQTPTRRPSAPPCRPISPAPASASPPPWTTTSTPPPPWRCCLSWPGPCAPWPTGWSGAISAAAEATSPALAARGALLLELAAVLGLKPEAGDAERAGEAPR
jgi:hypothetical protein